MYPSPKKQVPRSCQVQVSDKANFCKVEYPGNTGLTNVLKREKCFNIPFLYMYGRCVCHSDYIFKSSHAKNKFVSKESSVIQ